MADKELRRMNRTELIGIIYTLQQEQEILEQEKSKLESQLQEREIRLESAGSIAEAALSLNNVFDDAQKAAEQYLLSLRAENEDREKVIAAAKKEAEEIRTAAEAEAGEILSKANAEAQRIQAEARMEAEEIMQRSRQVTKREKAGSSFDKLFDENPELARALKEKEEAEEKQHRNVPTGV